MILTLAAMAQPAFGAEASVPVLRWPAVAGINYPAEPEQLLSTVRDLYRQADVPEVPFRLAAVVASAAPYKLAGGVSAHAFKSLQPGQYERVIVIAPGHGPMFENCSIPAVDLFLTPLGPVSLDAAAVRSLLFSPLFHSHQVNYRLKKPGERIHEYEFSIESMLPYLQERLLEFQLVPILVGDLRNPEGEVNKNSVKAIAETIQSVINERTLVVVATSFTHYGADYGEVVFKENLEENIARLDRLAFESLLALDIDGFRAYLKETSNFIDGKDCLQLLLCLLPANAQARLLAYDTSMAKTGEKDRSVSYAAMVFHDSAKPALSPQLDKVRPLVLRRPEAKPVTPEGESQDNLSAVPATPTAPAPPSPEKKEGES
ncbi:MAG TPA: AmmeMemoRadiSam system protein B [Candidatus Hydrogenedentes bacterium]|nr:AmmeMemoRadiSam system protein B [Candidatus Hydrogenedentota bacterium]